MRLFSRNSAKRRVESTGFVTFISLLSTIELADELLLESGNVIGSSLADVSSSTDLVA